MPSQPHHPFFMLPDESVQEVPRALTVRASSMPRMVSHAPEVKLFDHQLKILCPAHPHQKWGEDSLTMLAPDGQAHVGFTAAVVALLRSTIARDGCTSTNSALNNHFY